MSDRMVKTFALVISVPLIVLIGMVVTSHLPLLIGNEIRIRTEPVDPRSLFRGNYAKLQYDISEIPADNFEEEWKLRENEIVFVSLKRDNKGIFIFDSVSLSQPKEGVFLRGRIDYKGVTTIQIKYGIEAFFAPKKKALKLEKNLRENAIAVLMVSGSGRARIKQIISE